MAEVLGSLELTLVSQQKGGTEGIISKAFLLMDGWLRFWKDDGSSRGQSKDVTLEPDENTDSYSHSSLVVEGYRTFVGPDGSSDRAEANISPDSPEFASFGSEGHQLQRERNDNGFSGEESNVLILVVDENGVSYSRSSLIEEGHWNTASQDVHAPLSVSQRDLRSTRNTEETTAKQVTFSYPFSITEVDDLQVEGQQNESEPNANWVSKNSPYSTSVDDPISSYSPYLPPVIEELSSSYSEAGEDDPLPGIEDLQITGDAFLGNELQACGISLNGTTSCNFEWVRHLEGGSKNYIEGAKQPKYLVTADDVDTVLAIEVQPLDDRKRKGEIVTVFANGHRKITCDPNMQYSIGKTHQNGHASFRVSLKTRYLDIWEPATLAIKSEGYSIKGSVPNGVLVTEKILPTTRVTISSGNATEFSIISSGGVERRLREENNAKDEDVSCSRDAIVLTLRLFIMKAAERKKGKRRNWNLFGTNQ